MAFLLDKHYAVVFRPIGNNTSTKAILNEDSYKALQKMTREDLFIIQEAWEITKGKCVSN
jgi:hypothetical protein